MSEVKKIDILKEILGDYHAEGLSQLLFHCPRCEHHKKKLSVNIEKNVFKCWVCDWSGRDIYRIVRRYGLGQHKNKWRTLSSQVDINDFAEKLFSPKEPPRQETITLPKNFVSLVNKCLPPSSERPLNYLESRGVTQSEIIQWKIGFCADGRYGGRILIPSFNMNGKVNYFVARSYDGNWRRYLNPNVSRNIIFNELYLDFEEDITLVEGVFDAIRAGENSVPLLGSTLTERSALIQKIVENDTAVYIALDADADKKSNFLIELLLKHDIEVYKIDVAPYDDIAEMPRQTFLERKQRAVFLNSDNYLLSKIIGI